MVDSRTSSSSCPAKGQPSQFLVNAAPCRMLAWGKSLLNVKSCVSPTGPDHSKNRETVFSRINFTRPDQCPEAGGTEMFVRLAHVPNVAHICQTKYILETCEALGPRP